jgi:hypothetical protein
MPTLIGHHNLRDVGERWEQEPHLAAIDPWTAMQADHRGATLHGFAISRDRTFLSETSKERSAPPTLTRTIRCYSRRSPNAEPSLRGRPETSGSTNFRASDGSIEIAR